MNNYQSAIFNLGVLFIICFTDCNERSNGNTANKFFTKEEIKSDFAQLTKIIETNVPAPFYNCSKAKYDSIKNSISLNIPDSASLKEVYRKFYPLVQIINDAHFSLHLPEGYFSDSTSYFPFKVIIQGDKIFIKENLSVKTGIKRGSEIVRINSMPVKDIIALIYACNHDPINEKLFFEKWNEAVFYKKLAVLSDIKGPFNIELATGQSFTVDGVKEQVLKDKLKAKAPSFKILGNKTGYLKIPSLAWDSPERRETFTRKIDSAFIFFQAGQIKDLIIDIRENMGGSSVLARYVLDYIYFKPYTLGQGQVYIKNGAIKENISTSLHTPVRRSTGFTGNTILLNDVLTYSSAHMMQVGFQYYKMGKTIGEISPEPLFITGEVSSVLLKKSNLKFYFASSNFMLPGFKKDERRYYIPDFTFMPNLAERLGKQDVILEKAQQIINESR